MTDRRVRAAWFSPVVLFLVSGCGSGTTPGPGDLDAAAADAAAISDAETDALADSDAASPVDELRVLFLVDSSQSLAVSDPPDAVSLQTGRHTAVVAAAEAIATARTARFAIMRVAAAGSVLTLCDTNADGILDTDCYTPDLADVRLAAEQLDDAGGMSSWVSGFSAAETLVSDDLQDAAADSVDHVVVAITDGPPSDQRDDVMAALDALLAAADDHGARSMKVSVAQILAAVGEADPFLMSLAQRGHGAFLASRDPQAMDLVPLILP